MSIRRTPEVERAMKAFIPEERVDLMIDTKLVDFATGKVMHVFDEPYVIILRATPDLLREVQVKPGGKLVRRAPYLDYYAIPLSAIDANIVEYGYIQIGDDDARDAIKRGRHPLDYMTEERIPGIIRLPGSRDYLISAAGRLFVEDEFAKIRARFGKYEEDLRPWSDKPEKETVKLTIGGKDD